MIRTILKTDKNTLTLTLPDDLVGKLVEIIAFEIKDTETENILSIPKPSQLRGFLSKKSAESMQEQIKQNRKEWGIL